MKMINKEHQNQKSLKSKQDQNQDKPKTRVKCLFHLLRKLKWRIKKMKKLKWSPQLLKNQKLKSRKIQAPQPKVSSIITLTFYINFYNSESVQAPPKDLGPEPKAASSAFNIFNAEKQKELKANKPEMT